MSKELLIILFILALVLSINYISENYTSYSLDKMDELLNNLKNSIMDENVNQDSLNSEIEEVLNKWETHSENLAYYIEHDELEKVDTYLVEVKSDIENEDYVRAIENLDVCEYILTHIDEKQAFLLKNVF